VVTKESGILQDPLFLLIVAHKTGWDNMLFSGKKEKKVIELAHEQVIALISIQKAFGRILGNDADADFIENEINCVMKKAADNAGERRQQAEKLLYQGAFFPAYRGDYILFMDKMNAIAGATIRAGYEMTNIQTRKTAAIPVEIQQLNQVHAEAVEALASVFQTLHKDHRQAIDQVVRIEEMTAKARQLEYQLKTCFVKDNTIAPENQWLLSGLVSQISDITRAVSDGLCSLKIMITTQAV
jgi:uncharacterized protein Yka (UPF0111/DUF47 family)